MGSKSFSALSSYALKSFSQVTDLDIAVYRILHTDTDPAGVRLDIDLRRW